jgi:hypothetical protein
MKYIRIVKLPMLVILIFGVIGKRMKCKVGSVRAIKNLEQVMRAQGNLGQISGVL